MLPPHKQLAFIKTDVAADEMKEEPLVHGAQFPMQRHPGEYCNRTHTIKLNSR